MNPHHSFKLFPFGFKLADISRKIYIVELQEEFSSNSKLPDQAELRFLEIFIYLKTGCF